MVGDRRSVGHLLFILVFAAPLSCSAARDQRIVEDPVYTAPSRLVAVTNGRRLNLHCTGTGSPVVVFESGLGDSTRTWGLVQPEVSKKTRSCTYDRAGLGFSDSADFPRNSVRAVHDLRTLLDTAGERPPFVLVGHSYGGMIVKLFAYTHPSYTAGIVLVDPSHEDVGRDLFALDPKSLERNVAYLESLQGCLDRHDFATGAPSDLTSLCVGEAGPRFSEAIRSADRLLATQAYRIAAWVSEMRNIWRESADQVRDATRPLGYIPVIVLTKAPSLPTADETLELRERKNSVLSRHHDQTVALSTQGRRVLVEDSGHYIQLDKPLVVIEAILHVLEQHTPEGSANALWLCVQAAKGELLDSQEWWRIVTSQFLHVRFLHMLFNAGCIAVVGAFFEQRYGWWKVAMVYVGGGSIGQIASVLSYPELVSSGASQALMALCGASLVMVAERRPRLFVLAIVAIRTALDIYVAQKIKAGHSYMQHKGRA